MENRSYLDRRKYSHHYFYRRADRYVTRIDKLLHEGTFSFQNPTYLGIHIIVPLNNIWALRSIIPDFIYLFENNIHWLGLQSNIAVQMGVPVELMAETSSSIFVSLLFGSDPSELLAVLSSPHGLYKLPMGTSYRGRLAIGMLEDQCESIFLSWW